MNNAYKAHAFIKMLPHSMFLAIIIKFVILITFDQCRAQNVFSDLPIPVDSQNVIYNDPSGTVHEVCGMTTVSSVNLMLSNRKKLI